MIQVYIVVNCRETMCVCVCDLDSFMERGGKKRKKLIIGKCIDLVVHI